MSLSHQERGRLGHRAAIEKNPDHQSDAGKKGIRALASRYFQGSVDDAMSWLRSRQVEYAIEALVAQKHAAMLTNGREIAVEELPIICDPHEDVSYWRDAVSGEGRGRGRAG